MGDEIEPLKNATRVSRVLGAIYVFAPVVRNAHVRAPARVRQANQLRTSYQTTSWSGGWLNAIRAIRQHTAAPPCCPARRPSACSRPTASKRLGHSRHSPRRARRLRPAPLEPRRSATDAPQRARPHAANRRAAPWQVSPVQWLW